MMIPHPPAAVAAANLAHVSSRFEFVVDAPLARAAPLFGPEGERVWGGASWNPRFIHPRPARDVQGAVFTVRHGGLDSVWVNTLFDLAGGRMQYVTLIPGVMVSVIDVRLTPEGAGTRAQVSYTRTALAAEANAHVAALAKGDLANGPEWGAAIAAALKAQH